MAFVAGGLISLPGWANGWNQSTVKTSHSFLTAGQNELLSEIVETIIPTTDTPGAKSLGVHQFVQKMIADCYEPSSGETLSKGLDKADELARLTYNKSLSALDVPQRNELLTKLASDASTKGFYQLVKGLTIRGYMTSEYVMTNLTHYQMAPGRYLGCVPVPTKAVSEKGSK